MIINHNMSAVNANRAVKFRDWDTNKNIARLASGMRINSAADDATGLAVSEKMRTQVRGLRQAERNTEDGISFVQTAEGYLTEATEMIQRIRVLAVQSANGIYSNSDRALIQMEVSQLVGELDRVANQAEFNREPMLLGQYAKGAKGSMWFHMGPNANQTERVYISTMTSTALGLRTGNNVAKLSTAQQANTLIETSDKALDIVVKQRANLGAYANRMEVTARGLMNAYENIQAAESRIRDTDMAEEMVDYIKNSILHEAGSIMLAHANLRPQSVLKLLNS